MVLDFFSTGDSRRLEGFPATIIPVSGALALPETAKRAIRSTWCSIPTGVGSNLIAPKGSQFCGSDGGDELELRTSRSKGWSRVLFSSVPNHSADILRRVEAGGRSGIGAARRCRHECGGSAPSWSCRTGRRFSHPGRLEGTSGGKRCFFANFRGCKSRCLPCAAGAAGAVEKIGDSRARPTGNERIGY